MGSRAGGLKAAATRLGLSDEEYESHLDAGEKWCGSCRAWHPSATFPPDASRYDGLAASCRPRRRPQQRRFRIYKRHGWLAETRDGDRLQARRRVNYLVEQGRLPQPNALPCTDCGHVWRPGERRHEYDHHQGYGADHQLDVEPVCTSCHRAREVNRAHKD